jgi:hypothetical protein
MYVVVLARSPLQLHFEDVAFLMYGPSVLIGLAGFKRHWFVAQKTLCRLACIRQRLPTTLLEAASFQGQGRVDFPHNSGESIQVLFVSRLFAELQPKFFSFRLHVLPQESQRAWDEWETLYAADDRV